MSCTRVKLAHRLTMFIITVNYICVHTCVTALQRKYKKLLCSGKTFQNKRHVCQEVV